MCKKCGSTQRIEGSHPGPCYPLSILWVAPYWKPQEGEAVPVDLPRYNRRVAIPLDQLQVVDERTHTAWVSAAFLQAHDLEPESDPFDMDYVGNMLDLGW
jgi:hypothetical protein